MLLSHGYLFMILGLVSGELYYKGYDLIMSNGVLKSVKKTSRSSETLDLQNLDIEEIDQMAFNNLENVKTLKLDRNQLRSLPDFVFLALVNLEHLSLANNKLGNEMYGDDEDYDEDDENENEETDEPYFENVFLGLKNLKTLDITGNPALSLKPHSFEGLETSVIIRANRNLNVYDSSLFEKFPGPLMLLCRDESIVEWVTGDNSYNIENLRNVAQNCRKTNRIKMNPAGVLELRYLGITEFLKGWYNLQHVAIYSLDLAYNKINHLTSTMLNDLPKNVTRVYLHNNKIKRLEKGIIDNKNLAYLDFRNCEIEEIEDGALKQTSLRGLVLASNKLKNLNFLATLPTELTLLNLAGNNIDIMAPNTFSKFNKLERLSLKSNRISRLDKGVFNGLERLEIINLSYNRLTEVNRDSFQGLFELLELNLNHNEIKRLRRGTFVNTVVLDLNLSDNKITEIESGSFDLPEVSWVHLAGNLFTTVNQDTFVGLQTVVFIDLSRGRVKTIKKGARKNLGKYAFVMLEHTPWINDEDQYFSHTWDK